VGVAGPPAGGRLRIDDDDMIEEEAEDSRVTTPRLVFAAFTLIACAAVVYNALAGQPGMRREARPPAPAAEFAETATLQDLEPDFAPEAPVTPSTRVRVEAPAEAEAASSPGDRTVREIQSALKTLGHYGGPVDGREGPAVTDAIIAGERQLGLEPTGRATPVLAERLRLEQEIVLALGTAPAEPAPAGPASGETDISAVQRGLARLGYDPGPADGTLGRKTREAIRLFERDRRLDETGQVSPELLREIERLVAGAQ